VPDQPLLRRRTVVAGVGGLAAAALLAGCDSGDDIAPPGTADSDTASSPTGPASPTAAAQSPDEALVDGVLAQLGSALAVLAQARKVRALRPPLTATLKAHRAHVAALGGDIANPSPPGPLPGAAAALDLARRTEKQLHTALVDAAGRAESGALARLLASVAASTSQHLAALPVLGETAEAAS
jgi:hypothetical protein